MSIKETALPHGVASDAKIAAIIFQNITKKGLTKIQVRIPRNSSHVSYRGIQSKLMGLAKRQPLPAIDFSCRTHNNQLDEATGETFIRFHFSDTPPAETPSSNGLFSKILGSVSRKTASPVRSPPVDTRNTIAELEESLKLANVVYAHRHLQSGTPVIMHVAIIARGERFQELLAQMSAHELADWCAGKLRKINAPIAQNVTAAFRFLPFRSEEGTDLLGGRDIEIELLDTEVEVPINPYAATRNAPVEVRRNSIACTIPPHHGPEYGETLPPDMSVNRSPYTLEIRIEGTDSTQPAFQVSSLPVQINRELLIQAGLARINPASANIASQTTPLLADVSPAGRLMLQSALRKDINEPMYYLAENGSVKPVTPSGINLAGSEALVFVNAPQGVRHPSLGHLPAIKVQLSVRTNRDDLESLT